MEKWYIQLSLPNIVTIGVIMLFWYTFGGVIYSTAKGYFPSAGN